MYRKKTRLRKRIGARLLSKIDFIVIEFDKGEAPAKINSEVVKSYEQLKIFHLRRRITQNGCSLARVNTVLKISTKMNGRVFRMKWGGFGSIQDCKDEGSALKKIFRDALPILTFEQRD